MLVKHYDHNSELSIEDIELNISVFVKQVKFGPGDVYNSEHKKFTDPWMGKYNKKTNEFKLFKTVIGSENTSDFCVKGKLFKKAGYTHVRYSLHIHYMLLIGFAGLNVLPLAVVSLLQGKGVAVSYLLAIPGCILVSALYLRSKLKDLRETDNAFRELITKKIAFEEEEIS